MIHEELDCLPDSDNVGTAGRTDQLEFKADDKNYTERKLQRAVESFPKSAAEYQSAHAGEETTQTGKEPSEMIRSSTPRVCPGLRIVCALFIHRQKPCNSQDIE